MNKKEKIIVVGHSGSGKNYLLDRLKEKGFQTSIKITTRPKRPSEIEGKDYYFVNDEKFNNLIESNNLIVNEKFTNDKGEIWNYGIIKEDFNKSQAFIMTPGEINQIDEKTRKNCYVVYLNIDRLIREKRIMDRNDNNDSIIRRLDADEVDFKNFDNFDLKITDPEFDVGFILDFMQ